MTDPEDDACIEAVYGCTNSSALNHNPNATLDDGSCDRSVLGCTDRNATNYASTATVDDGSCECRCGYISNSRTGGTCVLKAPGCIDQRYDNYDAAANEADGSCENHIARFACGQEGKIVPVNRNIPPDNPLPGNEQDIFHRLGTAEDCARRCVAYQPA